MNEKKRVSLPYEFTHGQIKVKSPYPIQILQELEISERLNEH